MAGLRWSIPLFLALFLAACERAPEDGVPDRPVSVWQPVDYASLEGWAEDDHAAVLTALRRSCDRLERRPADRPMGQDARAGTVADWLPACRALPDEGAPAELARAYFEGWFQPVALESAEGPEGLITGYYESELEGAFARDETYDVPIYGRPADLVEVRLGDFDDALPRRTVIGRVEDGRLKPYHARAEIEAGAIDGQAPVVIWAKDIVDVFFLQVQGSGQVVLPDGGRVRIGFAGSNGLPFYAIGRALIDEGIIDRRTVSMQSIRDWLRDNPAEAQALMHRNERFIFFRRIEGDGPIGAQGVALTPERSLAVDPAFVSLGAPLWLATTYPAEERSLNRLMVAQDTGSAIKGVVRGDFFWGSGEAALHYAGRMKQPGRFWLLLPRSLVQGLSS